MEYYYNAMEIALLFCKEGDEKERNRNYVYIINAAKALGIEPHHTKDRVRYYSEHDAYRIIAYRKSKQEAKRGRPKMTVNKDSIERLKANASC